MKNIVLLIIFTMMSLSFSGCRQTEPREEWAIVLHGGAGSARSMAPEVRDNYLNLLDQALEGIATIGLLIKKHGHGKR